jgi:hypothetical protein
MHYATRIDNQLHHPCNFLNCSCKDFTPAKPSAKSRPAKSAATKSNPEQL